MAEWAVIYASLPVPKMPLSCVPACMLHNLSSQSLPPGTWNLGWRTSECRTGGGWRGGGFLRAGIKMRHQRQRAHRRGFMGACIGNSQAHPASLATDALSILLCITCQRGQQECSKIIVYFLYLSVSNWEDVIRQEKKNKRKRKEK